MMRDVLGLVIDSLFYGAGVLAVYVLARETKKTIDYLRGPKP